MSIATSEGELGSGDDDSAALPPSGRVALPESDPGLTAMLSRAAESVGCTGGLLLLPNAQGWTTGSWGRRPIIGNHLRVSFFPEVHEESD